MPYCVRCGSLAGQGDVYCAGCGAPAHERPSSAAAVTSPGRPPAGYSQQSYPQPAPYPPSLGTGVHHVAARSFGQIFGMHPAVAFLTIAVDLMMNVGTWASWGTLWVATIPVGFVLGYIAYRAQLKWYGDDEESAKIKALIVALLTAIPVPISPVLIPSGIVGLFSRKRS